MFLPLQPEISSMRFILAFLLLSLSTTGVRAQMGYEVGGFIGLGWYFGDISTPTLTLAIQVRRSEPLADTILMSGALAWH